MKSLKVDEREKERAVQTEYIVEKKNTDTHTNEEWVTKENGCGTEKAIDESINDEFGENDFSISLITKRKVFIQVGTQPPKTE